MTRDALPPKSSSRYCLDRTQPPVRRPRGPFPLRIRVDACLSRIFEAYGKRESVFV